MVEDSLSKSTEWNVPLAILTLGWAGLYFSTYHKLAETVWRTDEQGHGPIILGLVLYLLYRQRNSLSLCVTSASVSGGVLLTTGLVTFIFGRALSIVMLDVGSQLILLAGLILTFKGWRGLRLVAFPILFLIFMVPLPAALVSAVTAPLKIAVSTAADIVLHSLGYPVGQSGVTITIGQYELLVADACAGLNSMFTLEALGFLYMNIMGYSSRTRNLLLAIAVVPIAFAANVIRVIALILVTYYFGDDIGQGFVHGFAGMLLFVVALGLILSADIIIGKVIATRSSGLQVLS